MENLLSSSTRSVRVRFFFLPCTACGELGLASSLYLCVPPGAPYCQSGCASTDKKNDKHHKERERERVTGACRCRAEAGDLWPEVQEPAYSLTKYLTSPHYREDNCQSKP